MFNWSVAFQFTGFCLAALLFACVTAEAMMRVQHKFGVKIAVTSFTVMVLILGFLFIGFTVPKAKADDFLVRYSTNTDITTITTKALSVGLVFPTKVFNYKLEAGSIWDNRATNGANPFGGAAIGVAPQAGPFFLEFYQGVLFDTNPDGHYLSSIFEFNEDFGLGFKGSNDTSIVFGYRHISNAGLAGDNSGLDMFNLSVRLPL